MNTVLLVDDEPKLISALRRKLFDADLEIKTAISGHEAIAIVRQGGVDLIVSDQRMTGMDGIDFLKWASDFDSEIVRIMLSGSSNVRTTMRAINEGRIFHYFEKPVGTDELKHVIMQGLEKRRLKRENQQLLVQVSEQVDLLNCANLELERSNRELEQFSAVVAHDISDPLGTIVTFCQVLLDRNEHVFDSESIELFSVVENTSQQLLQLVDSVLSYACVERGDIKFSPVSLTNTIQQVQDHLSALISETGTELDIDRLPTIQGDEQLLSQLFQNLISNAIKYQRDDKPKITVSAAKVAEGWRVSVQDNGQGIADEDFRRVFESFQQVDCENAGVGLGLATCSRIMERHAGNIELESTVGVGTTFHMTFPTVSP